MCRRQWQESVWVRGRQTLKAEHGGRHQVEVAHTGRLGREETDSTHTQAEAPWAPHTLGAVLMTPVVQTQRQTLDSITFSFTHSLLPLRLRRNVTVLAATCIRNRKVP